jgi:ABC-type glycerol-3-phosphate transport system substrate-binding protein
MKHRTDIALSLAAAAAIGLGSTASAQQPTLELMHFWTSGGESNAMQVIRMPSRPPASPGRTPPLPAVPA